MTLFEQIQYYWPELLLSLKQTGIMMGISLSFGFFLGLFLGIYLFLSHPQANDGKQTLNYWLANAFVSIVRSFPFLLFVIVLIPVVRFVIGRAFGPVPAAFPLSFVAVAIFARLVEQVLLDLPKEITVLAQSLGASTWQYIWHFLLVEARSGLVLAFTTTIVSMVSYSTVMGIVGGGGIGDFAIRYGYQSYQYGIMYTAVLIMIVIVFIIQMLGNQLAYQIDHRK
ncbi:methionine ABC transporter permease [Enterococcus lemanii]|jgi:D-methionine transport system permease protein|uniref:Methionine ABC transporter permease n=1 Tax=Enterococcus lemanii TaxID=1159752 RepID=A0ABV9MU11_9ENTE|nr:ABC transporter permease subunit [Enterococcus lemanii]MBM7708344.1 D-methionine transport system permease protein [Enterococcus lemanii]NLM67075.1 ABC transporter permease subunit [Enterococcus sp.]